MIGRIKSEYSSFGKAIADYWSTYGGFRAVLSSPYFLASVILALVSWNRWLSPDWWDDVFLVVPSLLGFTLAGLAIFLSVGDHEFRVTLANIKNKESGLSIFNRLTSNFMHFVVVQVVALLCAFWARATSFSVQSDNIIVVMLARLNLDYYQIVTWLRILGWFTAYTIFLYSVLCALAAAFATFRLTRWYDKTLRTP